MALDAGGGKDQWAGLGASDASAQRNADHRWWSAVAYLEWEAQGENAAMRRLDGPDSKNQQPGPARYVAYAALALSILALLVAIARPPAASPASAAEPPLIAANPLAPLVPILLTVGVLTAVMVFLARRQPAGYSGERPSGVMAFSRSRAPVLLASRPTTRFADVAGVDEAKEELAEVVDFLKHPQKYALLGARIPKGVLLVGPPGTGKTLLARAVAGEAEVPFLSISGSEFVEMYVGVGAARVRDLFQQARQNAPCIVFVDEIDAVGRHRGSSLGANEERDQTLNQILVEMDGFSEHTNIIVLAATNRPDVLDPALLRPGRFDRQIVLDRPDSRGRLAILQVHARGKPLDADVDLEALAKVTPGFSGADLQNLLNEAALLAARRSSRSIGQQDLQEAIDRVVAGPRRRSRIIGEREKRITAYHEAGHALVAHVLPNVDPVQKITIVPRGLTGGYTRVLPTEDRHLYTRSDFEGTLAWSLAGRAAEQLVFGEISTGASNDVERATQIARSMVTEYGMSERLGPVAFGRRGPAFLGRDLEQRDYSDEIAYQIDREVRRLIAGASQTAREILVDRREALAALAEALIEYETLEGEQLRALLDRAVKQAAQPATSQDSQRRAEEAASARPHLRTVVRSRRRLRLSRLRPVEPAEAAARLRR